MLLQMIDLRIVNGLLGLILPAIVIWQTRKLVISSISDEKEDEKKKIIKE